MGENKRWYSKSEFLERFSEKDLTKALQDFAYFNSGFLPAFLVGKPGEFELMLDVIRLSNAPLRLPVIIRSTQRLKQANELSSAQLSRCLMNEVWPRRDRISPMGKFADLGLMPVEKLFIKELEPLLERLHEEGRQRKLCLSNRARAISQSKELRRLASDIRVYSLDRQYQELMLSIHH